MHGGGNGLHNNSWVHVTIADGRDGYIKIISGGLEKWMSMAKPTPENIVATARRIADIRMYGAALPLKELIAAVCKNAHIFLMVTYLEEMLLSSARPGDSLDVTKICCRRRANSGESF